MNGRMFRIMVMLITVVAIGYMMVSGDSPAEVTAAQGAIVVPILLVVLIATAHPFWQRWQEARAAKEIRRNQERWRDA